MTDITAFPAIQDVLVSGDNINEYIAGAAVTKGQVVAFHGTGVSKTVHPCVTGTTDYPVGVAIKSAANGAKVKVAGRGCLCKVANGESDATGETGDPVAPYGTTTAGTVKVKALTGGVAPGHIAGYLMEGMANSGTPIMEVAPMFVTPAA